MLFRPFRHSIYHRTKGMGTVRFILSLSVIGASISAIIVSTRNVKVIPTDLEAIPELFSNMVETTDSDTHKAAVTSKTQEKDANCIFRHSAIYRKIYVYPNPGEDEWEGDILSEQGQGFDNQSWPWLELDRMAKEHSRAHYNVWNPKIQYATELLVRELMMNPDSCLRTYDPEEAELFYVPYMVSTEHHMADDRHNNMNTSDYGQAILDIIEKQNYTNWEHRFGLTSKYWERREGSDHILVFSEPLHGLYHPRSRRGNFHFINTQKQLTSIIAISIELSTTFVQMYPACARKNILVPYPNTHGNWFNKRFEREAGELLDKAGLNLSTSPAALPDEQQLNDGRPIAQFYKAGPHGTCANLRKAMRADYVGCTESVKQLNRARQMDQHYHLAMQVSTFCPCPGGDSPSAKRMFDSLIAGCIPVILSEDFVWPFSKEFDSALQLDPADFSIRLNATDYDTPLLDETTCQPLNTSRPGMQAALEAIPVEEIKRLRKGVQKAGALYSWYAEHSDLPENPLREGILPDGGTAHFVVQALAERAKGVRWPACKEEASRPRPDVRRFKC